MNCYEETTLKLIGLKQSLLLFLMVEQGNGMLGLQYPNGLFSHMPRVCLWLKMAQPGSYVSDFRFL